MDAPQDRLKRLELLGALGAGVLGAGLALLFAQWLQPFAIPALFIGIASHGWAMFAKGRLEREAGTARPGWSVALEWLCWAAMAGLAGYVVVTLV